VHNVLENYTFPNPIFHDARTNVYAGAKEQILKGFSNMPEILQAYPSEHLQNCREPGLENGHPLQTAGKQAVDDVGGSTKGSTTDAPLPGKLSTSFANQASQMWKR